MNALLHAPGSYGTNSGMISVMTSNISFSSEWGMQDPSDALIQDYGLYLIDRLLSYTGKRLHDWDSMPQFVQDWGGGT